MQIVETYIHNLLPYGIFTLITSVIVFLFSLNLVMKGFKTRLVRAAFLFCLSLLAWLFCAGLMIITPDYAFASFLARTYFLGWLLIPVSFLYVAYVFARRMDIYLYILLAVGTVLACLALFAPVHAVHYNYFGFYPKLLFPWNIISNTYYFSAVALGLLVLYGEYRKAETNSRRNQTRLLWLGMSAGFLIAISETMYVISGAAGLQKSLVTGAMFAENLALQSLMIVMYVLVILAYTWALKGTVRVLLPFRNALWLLAFLVPMSFIVSFIFYRFGKPLFPWGQLGILVALFFLTYAILRYRLINITEIFQRLLVYLLLAGAFFGIWIVFIIGLSPDSTQILLSILYALIVVALFNPLHTLVQRFVDRLVFPRQFNYRKTILDVSMKAVSVLDYNMLIEIVRDTVLNTVKALSFGLLVYEEDNDSYVPAAVHGVPQENITSLPGMHDLVRFLRLANREIFREELEDGSAVVSRELLETFDAFRATLIIPMPYKGSLKGILCIGDRNTGDIYTRRDVELFRILANHIVIALENACLYELAIRDGLTKLYISRFFHQRISEEIANTIRARRQLSLLMIDIDHFKAINDTHGHQAGDLVLRGISNIISEQVRLVDIVSRYGGEEFAVILPETDNVEAAAVAERIRKKIEVAAFSGKIRGTVSIGIATLDGKITSGEIDFDRIQSRPAMRSKVEGVKIELIRRADESLYAAKAEGRNLCRNGGVIHMK